MEQVNVPGLHVRSSRFRLCSSLHQLLSPTLSHLIPRSHPMGTVPTSEMTQCPGQRQGLNGCFFNEVAKAK